MTSCWYCVVESSQIYLKHCKQTARTSYPWRSKIPRNRLEHYKVSIPYPVRDLTVLPPPSPPSRRSSEPRELVSAPKAPTTRCRPRTRTRTLSVKPCSLASRNWSEGRSGCESKPWMFSWIPSRKVDANSLIYTLYRKAQSMFLRCFFFCGCGVFFFLFPQHVRLYSLYIILVCTENKWHIE